MAYMGEVLNAYKITVGGTQWSNLVDRARKWKWKDNIALHIRGSRL